MPVILYTTEECDSGCGRGGMKPRRSSDRCRTTLFRYKAGLDLAVARGWLALHESGTFVRFTQAGAELFA
jgi:hypothetical protein